MKVRYEIEKFAAEDDKPVLRWLFERYHWASQWSFVAGCTFERYGVESYATNRVWYPTNEGRMLYASAVTNTALVEDAIARAAAWYEPLMAETWVVQEFIDRLRTELSKGKKPT